MSCFATELCVTQLPENWRLWRLERDLVYRLDNGRDIVVPAGFVSDGASIPRPLWAFLPTWGRYARAAALHDYLYHRLNRGDPHPDAPTREHADFRFLVAMGDLQVARWVAVIMWLAVRIAGGSRALKRLAIAE